MYAYSDNGLSFRAWDDPMTVSPDEVFFDHEPAESELETMFAGYALAKMAEAKTHAATTLSNACATAIERGFRCSVTGKTRTYTLTGTDQANLDSAYQLALIAENRATAWAADTTQDRSAVLLAGGVYYLCTTPGISGTTEPTWSAEYQTEISDGTAGWSRAGYLIGTNDGTIWASVAEVLALWELSKSHIAACRTLYRAAKAAIDVATSLAEVDSIVATVTWPKA